MTYLQSYKNSMCLANDTNDDASLLHSLRCIFDLEDTTLRRAIIDQLARSISL